MLALALQLPAAALAQTVPPPMAPTLPQIAEVRNGELSLKGYFWKPAGSGPFPTILFNHGSGADDAQHRLAGRWPLPIAAFSSVLSALFTTVQQIEIP